MVSLNTFPIAPGVRFRRHEHATPHLCVVLAGGLVERDGRAWRDVNPGTVRVSAAAFHDIDFGPAGARCLMLEIDADETPSLGKLARPRFLEVDAWMARVVRGIDRAASGRDPARPTVLEGLAAELVAQLERRLEGRRSPPPGWLEQVRERVQESRGRIGVAALAQSAGVHRVHLARAFHEHFGVPVTEYARRLRLEAAQRLLATSALPLAEVALLAGFADQSHMTRALRAGLGVTPGAVRRSGLHPFKTPRRGER